MLRAVYGDNNLKKTFVFRSIKHFEDGGEDATDNVRPR